MDPLLEIFPGVRSFSFAADRSALVVIDMQRFSADPSLGVVGRGNPERLSYYLERLPVVRRNISLLQRACRSKEIEVIFFKIAALTEDGRDTGRRNRERAMILGRSSLEAEILEEIGPKGDELVFPKTSSGIFRTGADQILRNLGIDHLIFTGVATNFCVETSVREAADRNYHCLVVEDGCAALSENEHRRSIENMSGHYAVVQSTIQVVQRLETGY